MKTIIQVKRGNGTYYFDELDYLQVKSIQVYAHLIENILGGKIVAKFNVKKKQ